MTKTLSEIIHSVYTMSLVENVYIDLNGILHARNFPQSGLWRFDGQVFYLPKELNS